MTQHAARETREGGRRRAWKSILDRPTDARSSVRFVHRVRLALFEASEGFTLITVARASRPPSLHSPGSHTARLRLRGHRRAAPCPEADSSPASPRLSL